MLKYVNTHRKIEKHTWERDSTSGGWLSPGERKGLGVGKGIKTRPHSVTHLCEDERLKNTEKDHSTPASYLSSWG